jgi:hypothetical protein
LVLVLVVCCLLLILQTRRDSEEARGYTHYDDFDTVLTEPDLYTCISLFVLLFLFLISRSDRPASLEMNFIP